MAVQTVSAPATLPSGEIVAVNVSAQEYLEHYAEDSHEWAKGVVIKMSPSSLKHAALAAYFQQLLSAYFSLNPVGTVVAAPFVMRLETLDSYREPDLQVILNTNSGQLTDTMMIGPADISIEIVSPTSVARDYGEKFEEYEKGGVTEYWLVDPLRSECHFYRVQPSRLYATVYPDAEGNYLTPLLPHLALHVPTLWQEKLPDFFAIGQAVQAMLQS